MFANGALINPVIVAPLMTVVAVRMKSSAVSVSTLPGLSLRESAPRRPSALPVVKKKGAAQAGVASTPAVIIAAVKLVRNLMSLLLIDALVLKYQQHGCANSPRSVPAASDDPLEAP
ncbi:MAG: hypothetical protein E6H78_12180 [Betaproteobacteria bacterium]|nr:MAG: hypothetical protein E6H78_12180 [Betaproteobacteria bacterium]